MKLVNICSPFSHWRSSPLYSVLQSSLSSLVGLNESISGDSWSTVGSSFSLRREDWKTLLLKIEAKQQPSISTQCVSKGTRAPALVSNGPCFLWSAFYYWFKVFLMPSPSPVSVNSWCSLMPCIAFLYEWERSLKSSFIDCFSRKTNLAHILIDKSNEKAVGKEIEWKTTKWTQMLKC